MFYYIKRLYQRIKDYFFPSKKRVRDNCSQWSPRCRIVEIDTDFFPRSIGQSSVKQRGYDRMPHTKRRRCRMDEGFDYSTY